MKCFEQTLYLYSAVLSKSSLEIAAKYPSLRFLRSSKSASPCREFTAGILQKDILLSRSERLEHPTIAQITIVTCATIWRIRNFNHVMKTLYTTEKILVRPLVQCLREPYCIGRLPNARHLRNSTSIFQQCPDEPRWPDHHYQNFLNAFNRIPAQALATNFDFTSFSIKPVATFCTMVISQIIIIPGFINVTKSSDFFYIEIQRIFLVTW